MLNRTENEHIETVSLNRLMTFKDHPFIISDNEEMQELVKSIDDLGTMTPLLVRPISDGKFEVVSGNRRLEACRRLGIEKIKVIIRNMTRNEAIIAMVDSNLHRERLLPSEKAFAYKMKMEALGKQGRRNDLITNGQVGLKTRDKLSDNDSGRQVQRYIRLTELVPEILQKVDDGSIAFTPAVELSYLSREHQYILYDAMSYYDAGPSYAQAIRLKKLSQQGLLDEEKISSIISEEKPNQKEHIKLKREDFKKYFPSRYTNDQIEKDILKGLELLRKQRKREMDSR